MANTIKHKRGTSDPGASDLVVGELAINTNDGGVFTKTDGGSVVEVGAGGGNTGVDYNDGIKVRFGTDNDLEVYHSGSSGLLSNTTGPLYLLNTADNQDIILMSDNGGGGSTNYAVADGSTGEFILYNYGDQRLATKSFGIDVTGEVQCDTLDVDGNADIAGELNVNRVVVRDNGASSPVLTVRADDATVWAFNIGDDDYSTGATHGLTYFVAASGNAYQQVIGDGTYENFYLRTSDGTTTNLALQVDTSRAVSLYYQNSQKFITKSDGVDVTGELQCDSLDVDGAANITGDLDIDENIRHNGDTNNYIGFPAADTFRVVTGGTERVRITSTGALAIEGSSNYGTSGQVLTSNGNDAPTWQDGDGPVATGAIYENSQSITSNYSITSGKNAMSSGPITINSGVTVTITSGSAWVIF